MNEKDDFFAHPLSIVEGEIGKGTRIWAWVHIMKGAKIGAECNVGEHCFIESGAVIGNRVIIKNGISIWNGITVEDDTFLGPHMIFTNDKEPRSGFPKELRKTLVSKGAV
jgi:UDP-2-acetamido-3-amino-2,3-dideoxy-glucuronate N-acetyltransferase